MRTAVSTGENPTQDSGIPETATPTTGTEPEWEETTVDISVTWTSPDYDPNTEGEYVFTPVIEGYIVSAELPEITVAVGCGGNGTQAGRSPVCHNLQHLGGRCGGDQ